MTDVTLVPECDVLQGNNRVPANDASQSAQSLVCNRIPFMRHRGAAFLALAEKLFHFQNFGALKMPKFRRPAINTRCDNGERGHKFGVPVALNNLRRKRRRFQSKFLAHYTLDFWIDVRMCANCAADFTNPNSLARLREAFDRAPELVELERLLQSERDRLGVHTVAPDTHRCPLLPA